MVYNIMTKQWVLRGIKLRMSRGEPPTGAVVVNKEIVYTQNLVVGQHQLTDSLHQLSGKNTRLRSLKRPPTAFTACL